MGKMIMVVVAFFVGAAAFNAAQRAWVSSMQARIDDVSSSKQDWLPPSQPVTIDTSQMGRGFGLGTPGVIPATRP
jgi:hypothetical protein